jgi:hypothetical protein
MHNNKNLPVLKCRKHSTLEPFLLLMLLIDFDFITMELKHIVELCNKLFYFVK